MSTVIKRIAIIIAMEAEAQPIIDKLQLVKTDTDKLWSPAPCVAYQGKVRELEVTVVHNGKCKTTTVDNIGTVAASLTTFLALKHFTPDLLINAGTAGGFKSQGAEIGDVFLSLSCVNHDRRIPMAQYQEYGVGMKHSVSAPNLKAELNLKSGVVTTGNSFDYTSTCMEIMKQHMASVKDMEAAAVAWTADLFETPMFCLKSVTDIVDGEHASGPQFIANLQMAAEALQKKLVSALHFIDGKKVTEL